MIDADTNIWKQNLSTLLLGATNKLNDTEL